MINVLKIIIGVINKESEGLEVFVNVCIIGEGFVLLNEK